MFRAHTLVLLERRVLLLTISAFAHAPFSAFVYGATAAATPLGIFSSIPSAITHRAPVSRFVVATGCAHESTSDCMVKTYPGPLRRRTEQAMFELTGFSVQHCAIWKMTFLWRWIRRARRIV
jgi:hypothetical protein